MFGTCIRQVQGFEVVNILGNQTALLSPRESDADNK